MPSELLVLKPEAFWFASLEDVSWYEDPADGRYDRQTPLRWHLIEPALRASTDALRTGGWSTHADGSTWLPSSNLSALTWTERLVLGTMFADPIDVDAWEGCLTDGRHRTWGAWSDVPDLILPLRSALIVSVGLVNDPAYVPPAQQQEYMDNYRGEACRGLDRLSRRVRQRSPRYVAALAALAER